MAVSSSSSGLVMLGTHLDVRNVGLVRATLNDAIDNASGDLRLDMRALEMIDAAGLGMLTAAHLRAERAGYRLILRYCTSDIRRVLAVTHLNRVLHIDRTPLERTGTDYGDRTVALGGAG